MKTIRVTEDWGKRLVAVAALVAFGVAGCESRQAAETRRGGDAAEVASADSATDEERLSVEFPGEAKSSVPAEPTGSAAGGGQAGGTVAQVGADQSAPNAPSATGAPMDPDRWREWPQPQAVLVFSAQQDGYIEPCGCTGLENQKGGLARRHTLLKQMEERGWPVVPLDGGNQVRRFGRQAEVKFQSTVQGLDILDYEVAGFGPEDLRLGVGELLSVAAAEDPEDALFVSANVVLLDPELMPKTKVLTVGSRRIGVTTALHPEHYGSGSSDEILVQPLEESLKAAAEELAEKEADFRVLLLYGTVEQAEDVVRRDGSWDVILAAADAGEPGYQPRTIEGAQTRILVPGHKGMYVCLIGLFPDDENPVRYGRVALTHEFSDSPEMMQLLASYQDQLKALGLEGLGLRPISHPSGREFVGSETCGECHTSAYDKWETTPHHHATTSLIEPGERTEVPRHYDPECLSCHVTGWNPQRYYPYTSGYLSLEETPRMVGNGCENCHGPGSQHVAAEMGEIDADDDQLTALREQMRLPLDRARETCLECHDLDNSPDFHKEGAFEEYWEQIEHYGLD